MSHTMTVKSALAVLLVALGMPLAALSANTFTAVSGADWNTAANWSEGVPIAGQDVVIDGNATLTNSTPALASLTVNTGKTLTFDGWDTVLNATTVAIDGTVTHAINTATTTNALGVWVPNARVNIACQTLDIPLGGKIDGNAKGYLGSKALTGREPGFGPGAGQALCGGGYGGKGGSANGGRPYGSNMMPLDPGSGGGSGDRINRPGGAGGGAVRIVATGAVVVDGIIQVNGAGAAQGGGGSGGAICIECNTFAGSGTLSAAGGTGGSPGASAGSGGGGRISVDYDPAAQALLPLPSAVLTTVSGSAQWADGHGDLGTLYFPDHQFLLRQTGDFVHVGQWTVPGIASLAKDSLSMNNAWLRFPVGGFELSVTNNLTIRGSDANRYKLEISNGVIRCGGDILLDKASLVLQRGSATASSLFCAGDMMVTNAAQFHVFSGITDSPTTAGALVSVTGDLVVASASYVYPYSHPTNGASVFFEAANLAVRGGSFIDASGKGYAGNGYVPARTAGFGPGGGAGSSTGGSYGGLGSRALAPKIYGVAGEPIEPGSGGGGNSTTENGGAGGGLVWFDVADTVTVDGSTILATGANGTYAYGGGGSGGAVYITCRIIQGTKGVVNASGGGAGTSNGSAAAGGGGRIAIVYDVADQTASPLPDIQFTALSGTATTFGDAGTLYFRDNQFLLRQTGFITHGGQWASPVPMTGWTRDSLVVSNGFLRFPHEGFALNTANGITVWGTNPRLHKLEMSNAVVNCGGNILLHTSTLMLHRGEDSGPTLNCASNFVMEGSAQFHVYAGRSFSPIMPGATVEVGGTMTVGTASWVYPYSHPTNGGSALFRVGRLNIPESGSGFDAVGRGFAGGPVRWANGYGPGGGWGSTYAGGAGYGGLGGGFAVTNDSVRTGGAYGLAAAPCEPGSGGGTGNDMGQAGGAGGGSIRIEATGDIVMNGSLLANASGRTGHNGGGGSGGGILLAGRSFSGTGTIEANGQTSTPNSTSGGGGGGRIAVWLNVPESLRSRYLAGNLGPAALTETPPPTFTGSVAAGIGANSRSPMPTVGTIVFLTPPPLATMLILR